jgi:CRISPR/Cas system CMR-associated protein Cmr1 (group 7 of RAMP superfamily)
VTKPTLLIAMEGIAASYAFSLADLRAMSIRDLRWWFAAAAGRQADRALLLTNALKGR